MRTLWYRLIEEDGICSLFNRLHISNPQTGNADAITVDGGDIYKGGLLPYPRLKPIVAEHTPGKDLSNDANKTMPENKRGKSLYYLNNFP